MRRWQKQGKNGRLRLVILTVLTMTAFAANSVLNRLALAGGVIGAVDFATVRVVAGAATLLLLASLQGRLSLPEVANPSSAVALTVYMLGFSLAYLSLDAGAGALILFGAVQVTMFGGALLAGEAISARRWVGVVVALAGLLALVGRVNLTTSELGAGLSMMAAGIGWGVYSLIGRGAKDPLAATAANFALCTPVMVVAALLSGIDPATSKGVMLAVLSGAVTSGLGYALWYHLLPSLDRSVAGLAQLSVPVIAAAGGVVFIGEVVTPRLVLSGALILGGVLLGTLRFRPRPAPRP
jgi:drug/metabolite transporter (DMT)-like permease